MLSTSGSPYPSSSLSESIRPSSSLSKEESDDFNDTPNLLRSDLRGAFKAARKVAWAIAKSFVRRLSSDSHLRAQSFAPLFCMSQNGRESPVGKALEAAMELAGQFAQLDKTDSIFRLIQKVIARSRAQGAERAMQDCAVTFTSSACHACSESRRKHARRASVQTTSDEPASPAPSSTPSRVPGSGPILPRPSSRRGRLRSPS